MAIIRNFFGKVCNPNTTDVNFRITGSYESGAYFKAKYIFRNGQLEQIVENNGYPILAERKIREIQILGNRTVNKATVNGKPVRVERAAGGGILLSNLDLQANLPFKIQLE